MGKPFIEINHTHVVINKLRKDINGFMQFVRTASMVGFSIWYVYLIVTNFSSIPHLIAYAVLFTLVLVTFFSDKSFKPKTDDSRKVKRKKVEKRRNFSLATKIIKYSAKCVTLGLALYASITNRTSDWDFVFDIVSGAMLLLSILCEFVTAFVNKYIDYLAISVSMDLKGSGVITFAKDVAKILGNKQAKLYDIDAELSADSGESLYTTQEQKIRQMLADEADALKTQKQETKKAKIALIDTQLAEAQEKRKQAKKDKVAATKAERQQKLEEKRQAKKDKANARREEQKRKREQKRQAKKQPTEQ